MFGQLREIVEARMLTPPLSCLYSFALFSDAGAGSQAPTA